MLQMQQIPIISLSPSFNSYSSSEIASKINEDTSFKDQNPSVNDESAHLDSPIDDDFEFSFVCRDADGSPISADEIFSNGQIRPIFPIFNRVHEDLLVSDTAGKAEKRGVSNRLPLRKLFDDDRPSSSSSESDELDAIPVGSYCVWKPSSGQEASPDGCKKSNSAGASKRWRLRNLLYRSSSDGKDKFVFSSSMEKKEEKLEISKERKHSSDGKAISKQQKHSTDEIHHVRNRATKEGDRRRSFLPYKQDLMEFFS